MVDEKVGLPRHQEHVEPASVLSWALEDDSNDSEDTEEEDVSADLADEGSRGIGDDNYILLNY